MGIVLPTLDENGYAFHIQKRSRSMRIPSLVLGEYSDLRPAHKCASITVMMVATDLHRTSPWSARSGTKLRNLFNYGITHHYAEIIIPQKFDFVNGFEKNGTIPYKNWNLTTNPHKSSLIMISQCVVIFNAQNNFVFTQFNSHMKVAASLLSPP